MAVERIYILTTGEARVDDRSIFSPGVRVGEPASLTCNAYLIRHDGGWLLWDTGLEDALARSPEGEIVAHGIRGVVTRPLAARLAEIGVAPADIGTVALSHAHFDHVGNCSLFPHARFFLQKAELDAMLGPEPDSFGFLPHLYAAVRHGRVETVEGDRDLLGDGALTLLATPGHTPGHSSLLVRLPSGPILLSGDVAHFEDNFTHRRVPTFNWDATASRASMDKVDAILRAEGASLWINHDSAQTARLPQVPGFFT